MRLELTTFTFIQHDAGYHPETAPYDGGPGAQTCEFTQTDILRIRTRLRLAPIIYWGLDSSAKTAVHIGLRSVDSAIERSFVSAISRGRSILASYSSRQHIRPPPSNAGANSSSWQGRMGHGTEYPQRWWWWSVINSAPWSPNFPNYISCLCLLYSSRVQSTQMLDDHSGSESPAQIDVLQQLSFVLLQSRDIQQGAWWRNKMK